MAPLRSIAGYTAWVSPLCRSLVVLAVALALPASAAAYDRQVSLDVAVGWGVAPALQMFPNHGPFASVGTTIGFDDTWALGIHAGWAVHPPLTDSSDPFHLGILGVEGLYYLDILEIVPFFGVGIDLLPSYDGSNLFVDFAAHARLSVDYVASREITVGIDVRPYILLTALSLDPVYLTFQVRVSFLFDY